jgi:fucokinase
MSYTWDYLILTASNDRQAGGYESQLEVRRRAGLLDDVGAFLVVCDPFGKRVGSGGSTLYCLIRVVAAEIERTGTDAADMTSVERILSGLRILILHAGGDSRRVPAYGPCGKIFSPVPGPPSAAALDPSQGGAGREVIATLFDRVYPVFKNLPRGLDGAGQVVVTAGDALLLFDAAAVQFARPGIVALGAPAATGVAGKHGVFCIAPDGRVRLFLQKPSLAEQQRHGAIDPSGQTVLDIGVMSFDARTAVALFRAFEVHPAPSGSRLSPAMERLVQEKGLDLYREICCGLGAEASEQQHLESCVGSGSTWTAEELVRAYRALSEVPFSAQVLPRCKFLHFGTTRQLITSGMELLEHDCLPFGPDACLTLNNRIASEGRIMGGNSWVEGCRLTAPLRLSGENVVVGVDIDSALDLPPGACLDVIAGESRSGRDVWFLRAYHVGDTIKDTLDRGATLAGQPLLDWLRAAGVKDGDHWFAEIWDDEIPEAKRSLWDARVFPAIEAAHAYRDWLWMFDPARATAAQKEAFLQADRYSAAEIALLADMDAFYARRSNAS